MIQLPRGCHKPQLEYIWVRVFKDGEAETEFDLETGQPNPWTPRDDIVEIRWFPVFPELSDLMEQWGEIGIPCDHKEVVVKLNQKRVFHRITPQSRFFWGCSDQYKHSVEIGEKPILHRENELHYTRYIECGKCGDTFYHTDGTPLECPRCHAVNLWECQRCGAKELGEYYCKDCGAAWKRDGPYNPNATQICPECKGRNIVAIGIIKEHQLRFEKDEVRCPDCEEEGHPYGLTIVENLHERMLSWLETRYIIGIEEVMLQRIKDGEITTESL